MRSARELSLERCIAQKLMPDIRFIDSGQGSEAVLRLSPILARGLAELRPCGVILFAENLEDIAQCAALCDDLQRALAPSGPGALIGIDQEGGRVTRLPRHWATGFSGNMALAACGGQRSRELARSMARAQAQELAALGINVNFVPSVDVNSNPDNPVIQVRSFGDDPELVATLGAAVVAGTQGAGLAASLKHFPGHGDTAVDSHTGLPRVERDVESARAVDLAPFAAVIRDAAPDMVMTAHIQYPCLDDSVLPGTDLMLPATLSRKIITGVLRGELGFDGVVITDAMDMRAISDRMSPSQAVVECFRAGVDIALMPLLVRRPEDLQRLEEIVREVAARVRDGELDELEIRASAQRIFDLRQRRAAIGESRPAASCIASEAHLALERSIAAASITAVAGEAPPPLGAGQTLHALLPDRAAAEALCRALQRAAPEVSLSWQSLEEFDPQRERDALAAADAYLVGIAEPSDSAVALGGAEDLERLEPRPALQAQLELLRRVDGLPRIAWLMRSPYPAASVAACADYVIASYDGCSLGVGGEPGPAFRALAAVLTGRARAVGQLPVQVPGLG